LKNLVCPPYDIISPEQQDTLYDLDPHNAVRLELPRGEDGTEKYAAAARAFAEWLEQGILRRDEQPSLYVYRQDFTTADGTRRRVAGVIGALQLERFGETSGVLPHERTMPGPKKDRLALMKALPVNVSPIYAIYRGGGSLAPFLDSLEHRPTTGRFQDRDGILHRLWVISAPAETKTLSEAIGAATLVIADGHHRYETALDYDELHLSKPGGHDAIMCFCVDADSEALVVLPYNRAVRTVTAHSDLVEGLCAMGARSIGDKDAAEALASSHADHPFVFVLPRGGRYLLEVSDEDVVASTGPRAPAWRNLDVVALHEVALPRLSPEGVDELAFSKDPSEVEALVDSGWACGVLMRAMDAAAVVDVARSGERMPQKASYFWPKAITGLVFHSLDDAAETPNDG
jgi:uncharacterized protein (DUF1015 family)